MKKLIIMAFGLISFFSWASEKSKRSPKEIFAEYGKMAQKEREEHIGGIVWSKKQHKQLCDARNGIHQLSLEQIEELAKEERIHLHSINEEEWEDREIFYQKHEKEMKFWQERRKDTLETLSNAEKSLNQANALIAELNSSFRYILTGAWLFPQRYQNSLSTAHKIQKELIEKKEKLLHSIIMVDYNHEKQLLNLTENRIDEILNITSLEQADIRQITNNDKKMINFIQQEQKCFQDKKPSIAFVKASLPKQHDRELFYEYNNRVSKE